MARRPVIRWDDGPLKQAATKALRRRMELAVKHVEGAVKKSLSKSQPRRISKTRYGVGFRTVTVRRVRGLSPSEPGTAGPPGCA